jgi:predicted N-acetyltransferase YhbS
MRDIEIRDMDEKSQYFVSACTHCNESEETDACAKHRLAWLLDMQRKGMKNLVALTNDEPVGFIHLMPIEVATIRLVGKDMYVIPCLAVSKEWEKKGVSKALVVVAENEAKKLKSKGLVILGYYGDYPFMPVKFFEKMGYEIMAKRKVYWAGDRDILDEEVVLWKVFDPSAEPPKFLTSQYEFKPVANKVILDLFVDPFCLTSVTEAQRARQVTQEFGDKVVVNEYMADDRKQFLCLQVPRGIFVNGEEIGWGYAAPGEGIREAISKKIK